MDKKIDFHFKLVRDPYLYIQKIKLQRSITMSHIYTMCIKEDAREKTNKSNRFVVLVFVNNILLKKFFN